MYLFKSIFIVCLTCLTVHITCAQTAEEKAAQSYVQNSTYIPNNTSVKGPNYYVFNGVRYTELANQVVWVGETAVMNSDDGSFQVIFKSIPKISKKYIIKPYGTFFNEGKEGEASIALLTDHYDNQYWSVIPNTGKIEVKIKGNKIVISVKNVKLCVSDTKDCKNITGEITLGKE